MVYIIIIENVIFTIYTSTPFATALQSIALVKILTINIRRVRVNNYALKNGRMQKN